MKTIKLEGIDDQYQGCGNAFLVTSQNDIPVNLIYMENGIKGPVDIPVKSILQQLGLDPQQIFSSGGHVYYGTASCYEFCIINKII